MHTRICAICRLSVHYAEHALHHQQACEVSVALVTVTTLGINDLCLLGLAMICSLF